MAEKTTITFKPGKPTSSILKYPKDKVYDDSTDYVRFDFYKYTPPFSNTTSTLDANGKPSTPFRTAAETYKASISNLQPAKLGVDTIMMYMPEDIGAEYKSDWGGKGFTNVGADAMRAAGGNSGSLAAAIEGATKRVPSLEAQALVNAINALPGNIGGSININDVLGGIGGVILNPNAELMFTGFEMRSFGLRFKMVAMSGEEAKVIRDIVTTFKKAALPRIGESPENSISGSLTKLFTGDSEQARDNRNYIGIPNLCWVQFMKGGEPHPFLTQYKTCAITNVSVNYTPDGAYATYKGGEPVAVELTLGFAETKLVYSEDIVYGGASY